MSFWSERTSGLRPLRTDVRSEPAIYLVRSQVIDAFFGRLMNVGATPCLELLIVSPWLTPWATRRSSLEGLIRYIRVSRSPTTIITRPPELLNHQRAVAMMSVVPSVAIYYLSELHAKFFVADRAPVPFALLGSANSTAQSFLNEELGVFVRGTGDAERIVRELQSVAIHLCSIGNLFKRRGQGAIATGLLLP
jgi:hypothetical protein